MVLGKHWKHSGTSCGNERTQEELVWSKKKKKIRSLILDILNYRCLLEIPVKVMSKHLGI